MTSGSVGVFPKNFLEPAPVKAAVGSAAKAAIQQAPTGRTKTVVMRPKDAVDKQTRRNIVSEMPISSVSNTKYMLTKHSREVHNRELEPGRCFYTGRLQLE